MAAHNFTQMFSGQRAYLEDNLDLTTLVTELCDSKVITSAHVETITHRMLTRIEQVRYLLDTLVKRPDTDWPKFCEALVKTGQGHIVDTLSSTATDSSSSSSAVDKTSGQGSAAATAGCSSGDMDEDYDDEDDDDVPDVPKVAVRPTEEKFYHDHSFEAYPMYRKERGIACIINVYKTEGKDSREGTHADYNKLVELFTQMHFVVRGFNDEDDLTVEGILKKLKDTAGELMDGFKKPQQCYVLFILSHGDMDPELGEVLYGYDGRPLPKTDVLKALNHDNLKNTPRLVCFVSCRGDKIRQLEEADLFPKPSKHFIVGFPCEEGYVSWRDRERGTRYVRCLVNLFMNEAHNTDVETLLNKVNPELEKLVKKRNRNHQIADCYSTLQRDRKLYLFPGIKE